jgi:hypothetical protein
MSTKRKRNPNLAVTEAAPILAPEAVIEQLRALRQGIPDFVQLPIPDARALRIVARADAEFLKAAISVVGMSAAVQTAVGMTADEMLHDADAVTRWVAVENELRALLEGITAANLVRRHRLGLAALQSYHVGRQLIRKKENADLLPYVATMRRLNRFGKRRAAKPPAPAPVPQPQPAAV